VAVSALDEATLPPLINRLEAKVEEVLARRETGPAEVKIEIQDASGE
jgi:hypothetical protein